MAGLPVGGVSVASGTPKVSQQSVVGSLSVGNPSVGNPGGMGSAKYFQEEGRVREVLQHLQSRLVNAQQLSIAISQQPPSSTNSISVGPTAHQVSQINYLFRSVVKECGY